jgi:hypothetical protein
MAPEVMAEQNTRAGYTDSSDLYALGLILWEMLYESLLYAGGLCSDGAAIVLARLLSSEQPGRSSSKRNSLARLHSQVYLLSE